MTTEVNNVVRVMQKNGRIAVCVWDFYIGSQGTVVRIVTMLLAG